jgi:hypothetical protein
MVVIIIDQASYLVCPLKSMLFETPPGGNLVVAPLNLPEQDNIILSS